MTSFQHNASRSPEIELFELSDLNDYMASIGTAAARAPLERLLRAHEPILSYLARRAVKANIGAEYEDLHQEARLSAIEAYPKFDPARGANLRSYVYAKVRWHLAGAREQRHLIRVPERVVPLRQYLLGKCHGKPAAHVVETAFGVDSVSQALLSYGHLARVKSIEEVQASRVPLFDTLRDESEPTDDQIIARLDFRSAWDHLDPISASCLCELVEAGLSQDQIAERHDLTLNQVKNRLLTARRSLRASTTVHWSGD